MSKTGIEPSKIVTGGAQYLRSLKQQEDQCNPLPKSTTGMAPRSRSENYQKGGGGVLPRLKWGYANRLVRNYKLKREAVGGTPIGDNKNKREGRAHMSG